MLTFIIRPKANKTTSSPCENRTFALFPHCHMSHSVSVCRKTIEILFGRYGHAKQNFHLIQLDCKLFQANVYIYYSSLRLCLCICWINSKNSPHTDTHTHADAYKMHHRVSKAFDLLNANAFA